MSTPTLRPRAGWNPEQGLSASRADRRADLQVTVLGVAEDATASLTELLAPLSELHLEVLSGFVTDLTVGELQERALRADRTALVREIAFTRDGSAHDGLAAYWRSGDLVFAALATGADGAAEHAELTAVLADVEASPWEVGVALTGEEILAAAALAGVEPPPLTSSALVGDPSEQTRSAVLAAARNSLYARGLLGAEPGDSGLSPVLHPVLNDLLTLMATSGSAIFVTVTTADGETTDLIAGRDDHRAVLTPAGPGVYLLKRAGVVSAWSGALERCGLAGTDTARETVAVESSSVSARALHEAVSAPTAPAGTLLAHARRLVTVRALRRDDTGVQVMQLAWLDADQAGLWRVTGEDPSALQLAAVAATELGNELRDAMLLDPGSEQ